MISYIKIFVKLQKIILSNFFVALNFSPLLYFSTKPKKGERKMKLINIVIAVCVVILWTCFVMHNIEISINHKHYHEFREISIKLDHQTSYPLKINHKPFGV